MAARRPLPGRISTNTPAFFTSRIMRFTVGLGMPEVSTKSGGVKIRHSCPYQHRVEKRGYINHTDPQWTGDSRSATGLGAETPGPFFSTENTSIPILPGLSFLSVGAIIQLSHPPMVEGVGPTLCVGLSCFGHQIPRSYFLRSLRLVFAYSTQNEVISRRRPSGYFFMITTKS